ncbi:hypothetical protein PFTANZ_00216 [Plasmodium falciparum Tanzania (2000708)]|uniref:Uncharacterized protein n=2 Tax=Plasmodium falciparum TaxID=5833 RepID=A0A024WEP0_PLAFA|nr:hypothetical protein PFTANZ_00216 [Plasmodium falciparum Tanzania (2000708)]ETW63948.1 hypothetical protein PFMC_00184 [Plasmodium falciparum CAMP/Malaysia]
MTSSTTLGKVTQLNRYNKNIINGILSIPFCFYVSTSKLNPYYYKKINFIDFYHPLFIHCVLIILNNGINVDWIMFEINI